MRSTALRTLLWSTIVLLCGLRFWDLKADFPNHSPWAADQAKYTDEGWWAAAAVTHHRTGQWTVPGDYNPGVAVPVWPLLLAIVFHGTGVSLVAARALNAALSIGTIVSAGLLVGRYAGRSTRQAAPMQAAKLLPAPLLAALLLASSPIAFAFSRLALLDTLVAFEFCLLLLAASFAAEKRRLSSVLLAALTTAMILTKTTSAAFLPAVAWLALATLTLSAANCARVALAVGVAPAILVEAYRQLVIGKGLGADYSYFFSVNATEGIEWNHTLAWIGHTLRNGLWLGPVLYPAAGVVLILTVLKRRRLWRNPLYAASWIALAGQMAFLFSRQEEEAPRYFLALLVPMIFVVVLGMDALRLQSHGDYPASIPPASLPPAPGPVASRSVASRSLASRFLASRSLVSRSLASSSVASSPVLSSPVLSSPVLLLLLVLIAALSGVASIVSMLRHRTYAFYAAARSIRAIVSSQSQRNRILLGVSAAQLALVTGDPSLNDVFGTDSVADKVARYQPEWFVTWNGIGEEQKAALAAFQLHQVSSYRVFDNDDRDELLLFHVELQPGKAVK